jgi:hypothetical protein
MEDISPFKALDFMRDNAAELGRRKGYAIFMQEKRKTIKAHLMAQCTEKTESAKATFAYSHPDYLAHLKDMRDAVADFETLRILVVAAEAKIEVWRSLESTARAEGRATQ